VPEEIKAGAAMVSNRGSLKVHGLLRLAICIIFLHTTAALLSAASSDGIDSTFLQVDQALQEGAIDLKTAVQLKAQLLYASQEIRPDSPYYPGETDGAFSLTYYQDLLEDVARISWQLNESESNYLASLSPALAEVLQQVMVTEGTFVDNLDLDFQNLVDDRGEIPLNDVNEWPDLPDLTKTLSSKNFVIHYTDDNNSGNRIRNLDYVLSVKNELEKAASKMLLDFGFKPIPAAQDFDDDTRIHVYLRLFPNKKPDALGYTGRHYIFGTKKAAVHFEISSHMSSAAIKPTCFHEYFHAMQCARNGHLEDWSWLAEATAIWAQCFYGGAWDSLKTPFKNPNSMFKMTWLPLWHRDPYHMYSTSALIFFLSKKYGIPSAKNGDFQVVRSILKQSATHNDGIVILDTVLNGLGTSFSDVYRDFLLRLYLRQGTGIEKVDQYIPPVFCLVSGQYGLSRGTQSTDTEIYPTGARFYQMLPPKQTPKTPTGKNLIVTYEPTEGDPQPYLYEFPIGSKIPSLPHDFKSIPVPGTELYKTDITDFATRLSKAVMIVIDTSYNGDRNKKSAFKFRLLMPYLDIKSITFDPSTAKPGQSVTTTVKYDFLGWTKDGSRTVQVQGTSKEIRCGQTDVELTDFEVELTPGADQTFTRTEPPYSPGPNGYPYKMRDKFNFYAPPLNWDVASAEFSMKKEAVHGYAGNQPCP
jgi:hypothetical protein